MPPYIPYILASIHHKLPHQQLGHILPHYGNPLTFVSSWDIQRRPMMQAYEPNLWSPHMHVYIKGNATTKCRGIPSLLMCVRLLLPYAIKSVVYRHRVSSAYLLVLFPDPQYGLCMQVLLRVLERDYLSSNCDTSYHICCIIAKWQS